MTEKEFSLRLAQLRSEKGVSARDMSLSIGQNASYINNIENGKALPSMTGFFLYMRISEHHARRVFRRGKQESGKNTGSGRELEKAGWRKARQHLGNHKESCKIAIGAALHSCAFWFSLDSEQIVDGHVKAFT